jgi:hypothetical protein
MFLISRNGSSVLQKVGRTIEKQLFVAVLAMARLIRTSNSAAIDAAVCQDR